MSKPIAIDPEFEALCPPLLPEEYEQLTASLLKEGCRDPLVVWLKPYTIPDVLYLLDGHNRFAICQANSIAYDYHALTFDSREEAINWIIANQLGRRNLTPEQKSYLRGKRYNLEKGLRGGDHKSKDKNDPLIQGKLADEYQVSTTTIKNDGNFASAIDILETEVRQDIRESVLRRQDRGKAKVTKQQTMQAGALIQQQAVQPQPFMKREHWKPYQVLEAIEVLAALPTDEHAAVNHLLNGPFIPAEEGLDILKNLATMPSGKRQQIYTLHGSGDKRGQDQALALAADKAPPPDPQSQLASAMNLAIEQIRQRLRRNWINAYPNEPWSDTLRDLEADLLDMTLRLTALEEDITTTHQERMAQYATTL